jgi:hypothetical protein
VKEAEDIRLTLRCRSWRRSWGLRQSSPVLSGRILTSTTTEPSPPLKVRTLTREGSTRRVAYHRLLCHVLVLEYQCQSCKHLCCLPRMCLVTLVPLPHAFIVSICTFVLVKQVKCLPRPSAEGLAVLHAEDKALTARLVAVAVTLSSTLCGRMFKLQ